MNIMRSCFTIGLAGLIIQIDTVSTSPCVLCRDYLQEGSPNIKIQVTKEDIDKEYLENNAVKHNQISAETTAVYRKIVDEVLNYNVVLIHGAVIATGTYAYMFSAPSGTGKTTHIKLWLKNLNDSYVVNGDKPLVKIDKDYIAACGTPWSGNENMNTNTIMPLKSIIFMERNEFNAIEEIEFAKAYPYLLQQTYIPKNPEKARRTLSLLSSMYERVSFYRFKCNNFREDCFEVAHNALVSENK